MGRSNAERTRARDDRARERARSAARAERRRSTAHVLLIGFAVVAAIPVLVVVAFVAVLYAIKSDLESAEARPPTADERAELRATGRIVFSRAGSGDAVHGVLYVMRGDGSDERRLGRGEAPTWSPDKSRVAFSVFAPRRDGTWRNFVSVMRADGKRVRRLTQGRSPDWSPDGTHILFERSGSIWIMDTQGGRQRRLRGGGSPKWSPDGRSMAFEHRGAVWVTGIDDGDARRLGAGADPVWSPDGEKVLFTVDQEGEQFLVQSTELAVVDAEGGDPRRLGRGALFPASIEDGAWSRDGEWIAFRCAADEMCVTRSDWGADWLRVGPVDLGSQLDPDWH